jgi:plastocyanin
VVAQRALIAAALAAMAVGAPPAAARLNQAPESGGITGLVHLVTKSSTRLPADAYGGRTVSIAAERDRSELSNVVVFVKTPASAVQPTRVVIRQRDEEFVPHLVAVTTGSTVEFPNDDLIFHNVFSLSRTATFDLGRYPRGQTKSRVFPQAGLVKVYCHLHSHMSALVRVFDHPYFAIPDRDGRFTIAGLPPRRYDVVAWHERVGEVTLGASVLANHTASLTFSLPVQEAK